MIKRKQKAIETPKSYIVIDGEQYSEEEIADTIKSGLKRGLAKVALGAAIVGVGIYGMSEYNKRVDSPERPKSSSTQSYSESQPAYPVAGQEVVEPIEGVAEMRGGITEDTLPGSVAVQSKEEYDVPETADYSSPPNVGVGPIIAVNELVRPPAESGNPAPVNESHKASQSGAFRSDHSGSRDSNDSGSKDKSKYKTSRGRSSRAGR